MNAIFLRFKRIKANNLPTTYLLCVGSITKIREKFQSTSAKALKAARAREQQQELEKAANQDNEIERSSSGSKMNCSRQQILNVINEDTTTALTSGKDNNNADDDDLKLSEKKCKSADGDGENEEEEEATK